MQTMSTLFIFIVSSVFLVNGERAKCAMTDAYPPPSQNALEWFTVNLDNKASDRWTEIVTKYKSGIQEMIDHVLYTNTFMDQMNKIIAKNEKSVLSRIPHDWSQEIESIAEIVERNVSELICYNLAYAIYGLCTSIVAQNEDGHLYHVRNLDFGDSYNVTSDGGSQLTKLLRNIAINVNMTNNKGETIYSQVSYAGFVGVLTAVRKSALTISVDTRFDANLDKYLIKWIEDPNDMSQALTFVTRDAIENYPDFNKASEFIMNTSEVGPAYIIIGGVNKNEGAVITLGPNMTLIDDWTIPNALPANNDTQPPYYVLETNYDHWNPPPPNDDRRYPAEDCMAEIGQNGVSLETLFNVIDGIPNRNLGTVYSALMESTTGHLEAYKQYCTEPNCPQ